MAKKITDVRGYGIYLNCLTAPSSCMFSIADVEEVTRLTGRDVTHLKASTTTTDFFFSVTKPL